MSKSRNPKSSLDGLTSQQALSAAKALEKSGKFEEALRLYTNILNKYPANKSAIRAIQILKKSNTYHQNISDEAPDRNIQILIELYKNDDLQTALVESRKLEEQFPKSINLKNFMGALYVALNEYVAAIESYQFILEQKPNSIETYNNLATVYLKLDEPSKAHDILKSAVALSPDNPKIHFKIGNVYRTNKQFEKAIKHYNLAIKYQPDFINAKSSLVEVLIEVGQLNEAEHLLRDGSSDGILSDNALINLSKIYIKQKRLNAAISQLKKVVKNNPRNEVAYMLLGSAEYMNGNFRSAIENFSTVINLNKRSLQAYANLGNCYRNICEPNLAIKNYNAAAAINDQIPSIFNGLGAALKDVMEYQLALTAFNRAIELSPKTVSYYVNKALVLKDLSKNENAKDVLKQGLAIDPGHPDASLTLSNILLYENKLEEAFTIRHSRRRNRGSSKLKGFDNLWNGSDSLANKQILVVSEQGVGDVLIWAECISYYQSIGSQITLLCHDKLVPIFSQFQDIDVYKFSDEKILNLNKFDYITEFEKLFHRYCILTAASTKCDAYLFPKEKNIKHWRKKLAGLKGRLVGISWKSPSMKPDRLPNYTTIPHWKPVFNMSDVTFINLQSSDCDEDLSLFHQMFGKHVIDLPDIDQFNDLVSVSELLKSLDHVISVNTAVASLAAAIGVNLSLLQWRQSPWNNVLLTPRGPNTRIYYRDSWDGWDSVFSKVASDIETRFGSDSME